MQVTPTRIYYLRVELPRPEWAFAQFFFEVANLGEGFLELLVFFREGEHYHRKLYLTPAGISLPDFLEFQQGLAPLDGLSLGANLQFGGVIYREHAHDLTPVGFARGI